MTDAVTVHGRTRPVAQLVALAAALLASIASALPPLDIPHLERSNDTDWFYLLHAAPGAGLVFGRDIHFTYGPLGFLTLPQYHPETYLWMLGIWSALGLAGGLVWWSHLRGLRDHPWTRALLVALVMAVGTGLHIRDAWIFAIGTVVVLGAGAAPETRPRWQQPLAAVMLGALALTKFTFFVSGVLAAVFAAALELGRRRRIGAALPIFLATVLILWIVSAGNPASLVNYLQNSVEISSGYVSGQGSARMIEGHGFGDVLGFAVAALVLLGATVRSTPRLRLLLAMGLATTFYVVWKAAFVRHDLGHVLIGAEFLVLAAVAVAGSVKEVTGRFPAVPFTFSILVASLLAGAAWGTEQTELSDPTMIVRRPVGNVRIAFSRLTDPEQARQQWVDWKGRTRQELDLAPVDGTFDIYPWGQSIALAWDLTLRPRPIPHSYAANTQKLVELNAAHLRGAVAPEWLGLQVKTIDERWPTADDAPSWLEILARYEPVRSSSELVLLRRRAHPRELDRTPVVRMTAESGRRYDLSELASDPLWISFDFETTAAGSLASLLLRPPPIHLRVLLTGEDEPRMLRLIPDNASAGFLFSPFIEDPESLAALFQGNRIEKRPLWFEIDTGRPAGLWKQRIPMTIERLSLEPEGEAASGERYTAAGR